MQPLQEAVSKLRVPRATPAVDARQDLSGLASTPLLLMTTGPGAQPEPALRLDGVVRSPKRTAALIAINDAPAEWLAKGEIRDGVTLEDVQPARVLVDTLYGERQLELGRSSGAPSAPPAAVPSASAAPMSLPQSPAVHPPPPPPRSPTPASIAPRPLR
jgi:hypothetical protein